jgi:hypothetical protein
MKTRKLSAGDWVEVRSKEEILATLDSSAQLDGMPFMPEMFAFCGRRLQVYKRAHKTCDTVFPVRSRRVERTVHLETRCTGEAHGGCEAACLIFWKEAWLKPVRDGSSDAAPVVVQLGGRGVTAPQSRCSEPEVTVRAQALTPDRESPTYVCQATRLPYATTDLAWWDIRQYVEDYRSGNVGLWRIFCGFVYSVYHHIKQAGIGLGRPMEWFYDTFHPLWRGTLFPWKDGIIPNGQATPTATLNLQPGELVRVKSHQQILATLSINRENRGMKWDAELVPFCGGTYRVSRRVTRIINEKTGKMLEMKTPCIILDSVICEARYSQCRLFCPRAIYPYWREIWLERASGSAEGSQTR